MVRVFLVSLFIAGSLVFVPHVHAATISELEKIIADLRAQVAELQNTLQASSVQATKSNTQASTKTARTPVPPPPFEDLKPTRYGEYNGSVRTLQTELTARGYYTGPITGRYAQATREAVKKFQKDAGIAGDGRVVNAQMIARISASLCTLSVAVTPEVPVQTIIAGTPDVLFTQITLTAPKTCGVTVQKITVAIDSEGVPVQAVAENLRIFAGEKEIGGVATPSWTNTLRDLGVVLAPGESITLALKASIVGAGNGTLQMGLSYIEAVKTGTKTNVGSARNYLGPKMKLALPPEEEPEAADSNPDA